MASFSIKSFDKKLKEMSSRQDSVQTLSLWLIHHRAHSRAIVNLWLDRMKKAKPDRRLIMFYLANDVIQNSRKKGKEFSQSFTKVLGDSMQYLRDTSVRPSVERVLKIWQERKVFEKDIVQKLFEQLNNASVKPKAKPKPKPKPEASVPKKEASAPKKEASAPKKEASAPKKENDKDEKVKKEKKPKRPVPANFKMMNVTRAIATMQGIEDETERRQTLVNQMRLDASSSEGIKQLKDYAGGNRFSLEFEESSTKYEDLLKSLEGEKQHRDGLTNLLEDGDAYYQAALKEATIIANAYRSFGNRLHSMKKKLDNKIRKFATAEKEAPVSAPKASFLGSGLSGILEQMNQSPAATPSRSESEEKDAVKEGEQSDIAEKEDDGAKDGTPVDPTVDHVEVADMDLDSDSGAEDANPARQSSDSNSNTSAVSSPKPVPALASPSPNVVTSAPSPNKPSPSVQPQFGYTVTVDSANVNETTSPASHDSAPSPDGSPDLNLEIYEGAPNAVPNNQHEVMTSFLGGAPDDQKPRDQGSGPNTMNLLTQFITKQWQNEGAAVGETDSPGQSSNTSNTPLQDESNSRPLINLLGNLLGPLVNSKTDPGQQLGESHEKVYQFAERVFEQGTTNVESLDSVVAQVDSNLTDASLSAAKLDSGPSTDEEGAAGDNTPEHGVDYDQAPPIIIRSDALFPRPPVPPSFSGPGQAFPNHPPMGRPPFMSPERMPRFPNEPALFIRDGARRPSIEEQFVEGQQHLRSPRMQGPPMEWGHGPPFRPRGGGQPVRESRDPRLRRRDMMDRSREGSSVMDRVPPMDVRGRPPGIGHPANRDGPPPFMEGHIHPPMNRREEIERRLSVGDEMLGRRLSVGDDRDGPLPFEERGRHNWEMRERFQPAGRDRLIDETLLLDRREGPHPMEFQDGPPHMRGDMNHPVGRRLPMQPIHRPDLPGERREHHNFDARVLPIDRSDMHPAERREPNHFESREPLPVNPMERSEHRTVESHPFGQRGPPLDQAKGEIPFDTSQPSEDKFHPPEGAPNEVPTSEEESPDGDGQVNESAAEVVAHGQNSAEDYPEGRDERLPAQMHEAPHQKMDNPEMRNEMQFNQGDHRNEHFGGSMFRPGPRPQIRPSEERSAFDMRPEFHMDDHGGPFRPHGWREDNRPIRPIGGPFRPRHDGMGRFPGPRNFRPNFGHRNFRPRHEMEGGRPRFPPMHGGPRLKRVGPPFHPDQAKRPHY